MARGGYRPGAGRKKGQKSAKIVQNLPFLAKAEEIANYYVMLGEKAKSGKSLKEADKQKLNSLISELSQLRDTKDLPDNKREKVLPLEFMLNIINDPAEDKDLRARMAVSAAPYMHLRKGEGKGKKDEKDERAKKAGTGKFASGAPPLKLVK